MSAPWKPDLASVSDPDTLLRLLLGFYSSLQPSGALLPKPTSQTVASQAELLTVLTKFYGAALVMGAKNLPRPTSSMVSRLDSLTDWLIKLHSAVT